MWPGEARLQCPATRLIDCWNSNLQLVINTLLIAYWFLYSYSHTIQYSQLTHLYLLFTEYVRYGPLLTYSWYKSSSVIRQEHWFCYSFLPESSSWGRLVVYIQTSNIRIRDILQNEENFKSFLVSPGYVCKARSHWCQSKVYYLSILLLPTFICLLSLKKSWWLYGWEQTANTESAGTWSFSRSKSGCRELSRSSMFNEQEYSELSYWMQLPIIGGSSWHLDKNDVECI